MLIGVSTLKYERSPSPRGAVRARAVCRGLLRDLIGRGLKVERARLFVIDGSKGLRKTIRSAFGDWALIQRCQIHKEHHVVEHLPESQRAWVKSVLRTAWSTKTVPVARRRLENLAVQLQPEHPGVAGSIREGLTR